MEKKTILLADDNLAILKLGQAIFETNGYRVFIARDGMGALNIFLNNDISLIISDILMPNMDGYSFCANVRKSERNRDVPIIIYSATYISQTDEKFALEIGANLFIRKPASMNVLLNAAKDLLAIPVSTNLVANPPLELSEITMRYSARLIEKLEEKNIELEQRNKDLEQFSYVISHNLRGHISSILGITNLLQQQLLDSDEQASYLTELYTATTKIDSVITDLNSILQLKHNESLNESVKFSEITNEVTSGIRQLIEKEHATIITDFSRIGQILSLKSYIFSIFLNLITNSIKYRQKDINPVISISSDKLENTVQISFKDNGLGIDLQKNKDKVFGLYKRFHSHSDGKGMGLFIVKTQVESLGGNIRVESEVNTGTEFIIELPL